MNIFLVESPLQMVNAIEARHRFPEEETILFIYSIFPKMIFVPLLERAKWRGKKYFYTSVDKWIDWGKPKRGKWQTFLQRTSIDRIVRSAGEAQYLFLGNYVRVHMRHIANRVKHKELILLDDGTDSLSANALRYVAMPEEQRTNNLSWWRLLKRSVGERLFTLDIREIPSVTFFSTYDINVRDGDRLIKNDYRYLKQWSCEQEKSDEIYFLGAPLSEDGYMEREMYFAYLMRIRDYLGRENFVYIPHPRESEMFVRSVTERCGIPARRFNAPIEIQLLLSGRRPRIVASFYSSALDNCRLLFGDELGVKSFYVEPQDLRRDHEIIGRVYDYLQKLAGKNFEVVKFGVALSKDPIVKLSG